MANAAPSKANRTDAPPPADFLPYLEEAIRQELIAGGKPEQLVLRELIEKALTAYTEHVRWLATAETAYAHAFRAELTRRIFAALQHEAA